MFSNVFLFTLDLIWICIECMLDISDIIVKDIIGIDSSGWLVKCAVCNAFQRCKYENAIFISLL